MFIGENQELVSNIDSLVIPSIILFKDFDTSKPYETYIGNFTDSNTSFLIFF